jgi:propanol-preferring alcohol dehydrogenase
MTGLVFLGNRKLELREFSDPKPGPGQVVVRMKAAGICGSDLFFFRPAESPPVIQGHEPAGVVHETGSGVSNLQKGDRVSVYHWTGCGTCLLCTMGLYQQCADRKALAWQINGCDADYLLIDARYCMKLPEALSFMDGAILACAGGTAYSAVKKLEISGGTSFVIFGAGPVGLAVLMLSRAYGARPIVVDVLPDRLAFAKNLGAQAVVDASKQDCVEAIMDLTRGRGAERILVSAGDHRAQSDAVRSAAANARVGFVGMHARENKIDMDHFIRRQITAFGSYVFPYTQHMEILEFLVAHNIHFADMVSRSFRLEEAEEVFRLFDAGSVGKFMFVWE